MAREEGGYNGGGNILRRMRGGLVEGMWFGCVSRKALFVGAISGFFFPFCMFSRQEVRQEQLRTCLHV